MNKMELQKMMDSNKSNINLAQLIREMYGDNNDEKVAPFDEEEQTLAIENIEAIIFFIDNTKDIQYSRNIRFGDHIMKEHITEIAIAKNDLNLLNILIKKGITIPYVDNKIESAIEFTNIELLKILVKECTDTSPFLMKLSYDQYHYDRPSLSAKDAEKIMYMLLDNGADINVKNKIGMTALMLYSFLGKGKLVKILLERGADTSIKTEFKAIDLATDDSIKQLINVKVNNKPQELVKILTNFTEDKPMKFTTHTWDFGELKNSKYKNFKGYMNAVRKQWEEIEGELQELSPNLYKKVFNFLWEVDSSISVGWSSLNGLAEWCDSGKNPFEFENFKDVVSAFKREIEIRKDTMLEDIFIQQRKSLGRKFKVELVKLKGQTFYTDTENFINAMTIIFSQIKERTEYSNIRVEIFGDATQEFVELYITQNNAESGSNATVMLSETDNGDFQGIKENLKNLCDWSIESSFEGSYYRVNYLKSDNKKDIELIEEKPKGFTHKLRFYNK